MNLNIATILKKILLFTIRKPLNLLSIDVVRYPRTDLIRRKKLLEQYQITKILDVGANVGQYANQVLELGFKGEIISFEPLNFIYKTLEKRTQKHNRWKAYNYGISDVSEEIKINVSENTFSSSILKILPAHLQSSPESKTVTNQVIKVERLDKIFENFADKDDRILLKIDVQGYEKNVLDGAYGIIDKIKGIQIEMSLTELYEGEILFSDMKEKIEKLGFSMQSLENGFYNKDSGRLLQVDGIFFRK